MADRQPGDSRLAEFLRRASPILAAERGWNERSQLKIKSLARDLELPAELYDSAVQQLQQGQLQFQEKFSAYEKSFIKYLSKQFAKSGNSVLTAAHESKAIRIARREFEIPQARARQLIRQVAERVGMSRVSKLDAAEYVSAIIDEQVGDGTVVPDAVRGRIYEAAKKWGVDARQAEILIANRVEANRQEDIPASPWKIRLLAGTVAIFVMLGVIWIVQHFVSGTFESPKELPAEAVELAKTGTAPKFVASPGWWAAETGEVYQQFIADSRSHRFPHELLKSNADNDRLKGYEHIARLIGEGSDDFSKLCTRMLARFIADDSQQVFEKMKPNLTQLGNSLAENLPTNTSGFRKSYRTGQLLDQILKHPITADKQKLVNDIANDLAGNLETFQNIGAARIDFLDRFNRAQTSKIWNEVRSRSFAEPEQASRIIDDLGELTRKHKAVDLQSEYGAVIDLLAIRPGVWPQMRLTLQRAIQNSNQDQLRELFLAKQEYGIPDLQAWIGKGIAAQLGIKTDRLTAGRIDEAIEDSLNLAKSRKGSLQYRWQTLADKATVKRLQDDETMPQASPRSIAEAVHYSTIAFLLHQANKNETTQSGARVDELLSFKPRDVSVRIDPVSRNLPVYRRIQRRALPSDTRAFEDGLAKLARFDSNDDQVNANAFERIARAAPRIRDCSREDATVLSRFMLHASRTSEMVAVEKYSSQLQHWPNLGLALIDELDHTDNLDQALTCVSVLFEINPEVLSSDWKASLKSQLFVRVAEGLRHTAEVNGSDERFHWDELRDFLIDQYRIRCQAAGVTGSSISAANGPAELAELLIREISKAHSASNARKSVRQIKANQFVAQNELHLYTLHTALLNSTISKKRDTVREYTGDANATGRNGLMRPATSHSAATSPPANETQTGMPLLHQHLLHNEVRLLRQLLESAR